MIKIVIYILLYIFSFCYNSFLARGEYSFTYSGLKNCCNVWGFWTEGGVAPGGMGIMLNAGGVK